MSIINQRLFLPLALLLGVCVSFPSPIWGQAESPAESVLHLSLDECVEMALANNSNLLQNRYTRAIAEAGVDGQLSNFLPTISTGYGFSQSVTGPREGSILDPSTGELISTLGESRTSSSQRVNANLRMDVFDLGNFARLSASRNGARAAKLNYTHLKNQTAFQARQSYLNLLKSIELLEVQQEQIRVSEESFRRSETLYEIGSAPLSDMLGARASLEQARVVLINRRNSVAVVTANLAFTLGLSPDVEIVPEEAPLDLTPAPLTYKQALSRAKESNPDLIAQSYTMRQSKDQLRATEAGIRQPSVSLSAGYGWTLGRDDDFSGLEDLFLKNYSYSFGLNVSFPVFNGLSAENNIKTQKLRYLQSQEQLRRDERDLALRIKQIFLDLERLRLSVEANKAAVLAAEEDYSLQTERYNLGASTFLERQQAQVRLFGARSDLVQASYDYQIELARLEYEMGGPVSGDVQAPEREEDE